MSYEFGPIYISIVSLLYFSCVDASVDGLKNTITKEKMHQAEMCNASSLLESNQLTRFEIEICFYLVGI